MNTPDNAPFSVRKTLIICVLIIVAGLLFTQLIFSTEPEAEREAAVKRSAMLVDVETAEQGAFQPKIIAMATVIPAERISLRAQVSGQVIERAEGFLAGATVNKGELLLKIEDADYRNQLQQKQSALVQAESDLAIEAGEQEAARLDYQRLNRQLTGMQRELILREPQMRSAKARVSAAQAALAQAQLDLQRTRIVAPFDAHVLSRSVNLGSQVDPNDGLAELVGVDTYWVQASIPLDKLQWLSLPGPGTSGSEVSIRHRTAWASDQFRQGQVKTVIGALEGNTRMARVVIEVQDPLARQEKNRGAAPLVLGSYVEVEISAQTLSDVVRLERAHVRKNNTAWVMENNALAIRPLTILFTDANYAYIGEGLQQGDKVVTTSLSRVRNGAALRLRDSASEGPDA